MTGVAEWSAAAVRGAAVWAQQALSPKGGAGVDRSVGDQQARATSHLSCRDRPAQINASSASLVISAGGITAGHIRAGPASADHAGRDPTAAADTRGDHTAGCESSGSGSPSLRDLGDQARILVAPGAWPPLLCETPWHPPKAALEPSAVFHFEWRLL